MKEMDEMADVTKSKRHSMMGPLLGFEQNSLGSIGVNGLRGRKCSGVQGRGEMVRLS